MRNCAPGLKCSVVFSGLDASVAGGIEDDFARAGYAVLSNSKNHRMDEDVPLVIPELNHDHLGLIALQKCNRGGSGYIVTNSNCSTMFLAMALGPLHRAFTVEKVFVNVNKYGNTSAASIPIALCEAFEEGRAKVGDTLAFVAFGAGLTWASAIVKVVENVKPIPKPWWQNLSARWFSRDHNVKKDGHLVHASEASSEPEVENT